MSDDGYRIKKMPPGLEHLFHSPSHGLPFCLPALSPGSDVAMRELFRTVLPRLPDGLVAEEVRWLLASPNAAGVRVSAICGRTAEIIAASVQGAWVADDLVDTTQRLRTFAEEARRLWVKTYGTSMVACLSA